MRTNGERSHIFVFGSNLAGIHGAGSARAAHELHGACWGEGVGRTGNAYAIPTKNHDIETMPIHEIAVHVSMFLAYATAHPEYVFDVVKIGCGLAGLKEADVAPLFKDAPANCNLPDGWRAMTTPTSEPTLAQLLDAFEEAANQCGLDSHDHERGGISYAEWQRSVQKEEVARKALTAHVDALRIALANAERERERINTLESALVQYANSINWMTHTDDADDSIRRVWVGSDDGRYYAREALEDSDRVEMDSMADFYEIHPPHSRDGIT